MGNPAFFIAAFPCRASDLTLESCVSVAHCSLFRTAAALVAALCLASAFTKQGWEGSPAILESGDHVGTAARTFHARGRLANAGVGKGAYRCFVVDGKAKCVQASSNALAKRKIVEMSKSKVPTTIITPQHLDEIKSEVSDNYAAAGRLLADEGWAGLEKSQQHMAALIADKVRSLSRMVGTLRASHDGIVQELIAKAAAPGPPVLIMRMSSLLHLLMCMWLHACDLSVLIHVSMICCAIYVELVCSILSYSLFYAAGPSRATWRCRLCRPVESSRTARRSWSSWSAGSCG